MLRSVSAVSRWTVVVAALLAIACKGSVETTEPLKMWSIDFGTGVDAQNQITGPTRNFTPSSIVYASITTRGAGRGTLIVEWAAGSTVVATQKQEIAPTRPDEHFAFHFTPPEGWPKGPNHVRFALDDGEKHVADFQVD